MRFVKPLDKNLLHKIFKKHPKIISIEDGTIKGGFGSAISEFAIENNYKNLVKVLGIPDNFIHHGTVEELQKKCTIDIVSISNEISDLLKINH